MPDDQPNTQGRRLRVLLVYPPSRTQSHYSCPVGLLMLGAVLEKAGHEVHLLDANASERRLTSEQVADEARRLAPDVIGVTLLTPLVREAYRLAGLLRGTGARLLAGGPHATLVPEEPLDHGFDAVVVGEGEPAIEGAALALAGLRPRREVPGLLWRDESGAVQRTPQAPPPQDLDALPFPARHLARQEDYQPLSVEATVFSSRGCTARCAYCAGGLFGKRFRFRSAQNVLDEVMLLHRTYGTRHIHFCDDAMSLDKKRLRQICEGLIAAGKPVSWSMMTRIDGVDEELLRLAAAAGCTRVDYGVESGSPSTLRAIKKPHTLEMARRIVPLTKQVGMVPGVFFIVGFPWEDVAAIEETRRHMEELAPHVGEFHPAVGTVLVPFPGTALYEEYKDRYGFAGWWLGTDRNFEVPTPGTHAYYEYVAFRNGAILDADFFHYSPEVRTKLIEVFRFMYFWNLRSRGLLRRTLLRVAFSTSLALSRHWPKAERLLFWMLGRAVEQARRRHQDVARRAMAEVPVSA